VPENMKNAKNINNTTFDLLSTGCMDCGIEDEMINVQDAAEIAVFQHFGC
jgi:hypothetical protein